MNIPAELRYSKEHEWVRVEGKVAVVGITDFAQEELGDIVNVELPDENDTFALDEAFGAVESVKASSEVFCPVSGKVIEINEPLFDTPEILNEDPYDEGWMIKIEMTDASEADKLMDAAAYHKYIEDESK